MASLGTESGPHPSCDNLTPTDFTDVTSTSDSKADKPQRPPGIRLPSWCQSARKPDGLFWQLFFLRRSVASSSLKSKYGEQAEKRRLRNIHEEHKKVKCPVGLLPPSKFLPGQYFTSVLAIFPLARAPFSSLFAQPFLTSADCLLCIIQLSLFLLLITTGQVF